MRKIVFLVPALLLAGCRGEQVVFQFQPAPATAVALPPQTAATTLATLPTEPVAAAVPAPATASVKPMERLRSHRLAAAIKALPTNTLTATELPAQASRQLSKHLRRHATEGAAENGLGRVALFFIAVALSVVAGLAALVNLIFSVGFFTALGYTAAGLVVLFLLYSLLSGGKKKPSATPAK